MSIAWSPTQRTQVHAVLTKHPAESQECFEAAHKIVPIARTLDGGARARRILPRSEVAWFVPQYVHIQRRWESHAFVLVTAHAVDALTGADGHPLDSYFQTHFPETFEHLEVSDF